MQIHRSVTISSTPGTPPPAYSSASSVDRVESVYLKGRTPAPAAALPPPPPAATPGAYRKLQGMGVLCGGYCVAADQALIVLSKGQEVKVWDRNQKEVVRTLHAHKNEIRAICLIGDAIISAAARSIKIWKRDRIKCVRTLEGHEKPITSLAADDEDAGERR